MTSCNSSATNTATPCASCKSAAVRCAYGLYGTVRRHAHSATGEIGLSASPPNRPLLPAYAIEAPPASSQLSKPEPMPTVEPWLNNESPVKDLEKKIEQAPEQSKKLEKQLKASKSQPPAPPKNWRPKPTPRAPTVYRCQSRFRGWYLPSCGRRPQGQFEAWSFWELLAGVWRLWPLPIH